MTDCPPPVAIEEEEQVLGAVMIVRSLLAVCTVEVGLRPEHFYYDKHAAIFRAVLTVSARGDEVSEQAVWRELESKPPDGVTLDTLHEMTSNVAAPSRTPTAARQVIESASLRAKREGAQMILAGVDQRDPEMIGAGLQRASSDIEADAQPTTPEEIGSWMYDWLDAGYQDSDIFTLPWEVLNECTAGGYKRGQMSLLTGWSGMGKAIDVDTPVPTPAGWTTMGGLREGDTVFDENGRPTRVLHAFAPMEGRPCFEIEFSDGARVVADADHRWRTYDRGARRSETLQRKLAGERTGQNDQRDRRRLPAVRTTREIADTLKASTAGCNHSIPLCGPLQYPATALPVDPYVLGAWLGDGSSRGAQITSADPGVIAEIERHHGVKKLKAKYLYAIRDLSPHLRALGVLGRKHVPAGYLEASVADRWALLQGMMDTDGTVAGSGSTAEYCTTNKALAEGFRELALGLGLRVTVATERATWNGKDCGEKFRLRFPPHGHRVFRLARKQDRVPAKRPAKLTHRFIKAVRPVPSRTVRCISVDSPNHLFLVGRECIPTHNSLVLDQMLTHWSARGHRCLLLTTEMQLQELVARFLTKETGIAYEKLILRKLSESEWKRVVPVLGKIPWHHHDADGWGVERILSAIVNKRPDIACIDPWNLIPHKDRFSMDETARQLKTVARRANCHVVVVAHLNTARMKDGQKPRPVQRDIRDTGMLYNNAHFTLCLHRENANGKSKRKGELYLMKAREGMEDGVDVEFNARHLRFDPLGASETAQGELGNTPEEIFG